MTYHADHAWQAGYLPALAVIAAGAIRVEVAGVEDDQKRNTDLIVLRMANDLRVSCRVRRADYRYRYADEFTVRLDRPSGAPSEMAKLRAGDGDFGIYAFASPDRDGELSQWVLYNLDLLREYLDARGRWERRANADGSSTFAAFDIGEVAGAELGFVLNSSGLMLDAWPAPVGNCRLCGRASWTADDVGPVHECCAKVPAGETCHACQSSERIGRVHYGWPRAATS